MITMQRIILVCLSSLSLSVCSDNNGPPPDLVAIPKVPVEFTIPQELDAHISLGPVTLSDFVLSEAGSKYDSVGAKPKVARGVFWRLEYVATNLLERPTYAVPMLQLVDERGVPYSCVEGECDRINLQPLPAGGARAEVALFDLPKSHRPVTLRARGARPDGQPAVGSWPTGVSPPSAPKRKKRPHADVP